MELSYSDNGNYSGINPSNTDTNCQGPIAKMAQAITNSGATARCLSYTNSGLSDVFQRWGASGIKGTSTPIQAWSSDPMGAVTWMPQGVNTSGVPVSADVSMNWATANTACSTAGGRLPSMEELKTLSDASYAASGNTSHAPPGFVASCYWSSVTVPSVSTYAYYVCMGDGGIGGDASKSNAFYVRCVR